MPRPDQKLEEINKEIDEINLNEMAASILFIYASDIIVYGKSYYTEESIMIALAQDIYKNKETMFKVKNLLKKIGGPLGNLDIEGLSGKYYRKHLVYSTIADIMTSNLSEEQKIKLAHYIYQQKQDAKGE